jgi:hypothetical protein
LIVRGVGGERESMIRRAAAVQNLETMQRRLDLDVHAHARTQGCVIATF